MDGESGLKTYFADFSTNNSSSFDIVILDYQLSGKNGMQVASEILSKKS